MSDEAAVYPEPVETFRGRAVWEMGEDCDQGVIVQGHGIGAWMTLYLYCRDRGMETPADARPQFPRPAERWMTFTEDCGCTTEEHAQHVADADPDGYVDCEASSDGDHCHELGPCSPDRFGWMITWHPDATTRPPEAAPVLVWDV